MFSIVGAGGLGSPILLYSGCCRRGHARHRRSTTPCPYRTCSGRCSSRPRHWGNLRSMREPTRSAASIPTSSSNPHKMLITADDAADAGPQRYDVVVDGSDNWTTRYAVSDACYRAERPLVMGSVGTFDGAVTVLKPYEGGPEWAAQPDLPLSLSDAAATRQCTPTCAEGGDSRRFDRPNRVQLMALEVIRVSSYPFGDGLLGRLLLVDARSMRFETLAYSWDPENSLNGSHSTTGLRSVEARPSAMFDVRPARVASDPMTSAITKRMITI